MEERAGEGWGEAGWVWEGRGVEAREEEGRVGVVPVMEGAAMIRFG